MGVGESLPFFFFAFVAFVAPLAFRGFEDDLLLLAFEAETLPPPSAKEALVERRAVAEEEVDGFR